MLRQRLGFALIFRIVALENFNNRRIKRTPRFPADYFHRLFKRECPPVLAIARQRIQTIDDGNDSRADRDFFALQPVRIPVAIPLFMMAAHDGHHRIWELHGFENLRAHRGMDLHLLELLVREFARLVDDELRHSQFADVV